MGSPSFTLRFDKGPAGHMVFAAESYEVEDRDGVRYVKLDAGREVRMFENWSVFVMNQLGNTVDRIYGQPRGAAPAQLRQA